jgi:hypothetical protein
MKVTSLVNIGKGLEKLLTEIDIKSAEDFLKEDPEDLYYQLEKKHPNLHLAVLASFIGAHSNTPWYIIYEDVKKRQKINS